MGNWKIILFFLAGTLFFFWLLRWQGQTLVNTVSPAGIISLELAFDSGKASSIVNTWKESRHLSFLLNMLLDFLLIPFYGLFFYSICGFFSGQYGTGALQRVAVLLAFGSLVAVVMDVGENLLMLTSFYIGVLSPLVWLTGIAAVIKFALIAVSIVYIIFSSVHVLLRRVW